MNKQIMADIEDAEIIGQAVYLLIKERDQEARIELVKLGQDDPVRQTVVESKYVAQRPPRTRRSSMPRSLFARILKRDRFRCRYCGRRLVFGGVIELVGTLCPAEFPFPSGHHMPIGRTHPAAIRVYANVDHINAGALGGDWLDPNNLVAACTPCNELKSDRFGWSTRIFDEDDWQGLTDSYRALAGRVAPPRNYHLEWFRAFGI